jgi:hypothetical protein
MEGRETDQQAKKKQVITLLISTKDIGYPKVKPIYQKFQLLLNAQYNENLPDS